jgi:hypothetical protein
MLSDQLSAVFFMSCFPTLQLVPPVSQYNILPRAEHLAVHSSTGCVVLYDGRVAWSDLAAHSTQVLAQYVLLQDTHSVRTQALQLVQSLGTLRLLQLSSSVIYPQRCCSG